VCVCVCVCVCVHACATTLLVVVIARHSHAAHQRRRQVREGDRRVVQGERARARVCVTRILIAPLQEEPEDTKKKAADVGSTSSTSSGTYVCACGVC
jgi:hypothetical protein